MDRPDSSSPQPGASPIKAFLIILALIILTTVIFLMTANGEESPDATRSPPTNSTPDFSLTDEEAIARFKELYQMSLAIYEERDVSLLPLVYVPGSSIYGDVQEEVTDLKKDGVLADLTARTKSIKVESNLADGIRIRQVVTMRARFLDEKHKDVTIRGGDAIQTIEWLLKPDQSKWLIYSATIVEAKQIGERDQ